MSPISIRSLQAMKAGQEKFSVLTAYDATYLELALRTGSTLATFDTRLAAAMKQAGGKIYASSE